ncbi:MAG: hypothetical protein K4305_08945 [Chlorobium sp.]|uniref:hypothetical protein n=1 Tax=Chlorobium sp. TaxID=1095 RepID=UPI002F3E8279
MKQKVFRETLPCLLTDGEKIEKGRELSGLIATIGDLQVQKKAHADRLKKEIEGHEVEVEDISKIIRDGFEFRMVECIEERDYEKMMIHVIRTDCGSIVRSRAMTIDERQESMFEEQAEEADVMDVSADGAGFRLLKAMNEGE